jgi:prepilin-type processing-associated H-X9-DG protein
VYGQAARRGGEGHRGVLEPHQLVAAVRAGGISGGVAAAWADGHVSSQLHRDGPAGAAAVARH